MVSMKDIAKRCGVSVATVSKALNGQPDIGEETRARISAVAEELGDTGRILVRESGTEPVIRVMVEAPSQELCLRLVDQVVDTICARGHARV